MDDHSIARNNRTKPCTPAFAEAWQVASGARMRTAQQLVPKTEVQDAAFTSDPDTVAVVSYVNGNDGRIEVRDLTTGRLRYRLAQSALSSNPLGILRAGGELLLKTDGTTTYARTLGRTPGRTIKIPTMGSTTDATGRYGVDGSTSIDDLGVPGNSGYTEATLTGLHTGRTYRARIPTSGDAPGSRTSVAAVPRTGGGLTVLVPVGTALMTVRAEPVGPEQFQANADRGERYSASPDGRFLARATGQQLEVMNALPHYVDSVAALQGSEIALLTETGTLARVDAADASLLNRPFLVHLAPNSTDPFPGAFLTGQLIARPGHPGQVAAVTRAGALRGEILLVGHRRAVAHHDTAGAGHQRAVGRPVRHERACFRCKRRAPRGAELRRPGARVGRRPQKATGPQRSSRICRHSGRLRAGRQRHYVPLGQEADPDLRPDGRRHRHHPDRCCREQRRLDDGLRARLPPDPGQRRTAPEIRPERRRPIPHPLRCRSPRLHRGCGF